MLGQLQVVAPLKEIMDVLRDTPRIETIYWLGPRDPLTSESVEGQTWGRHGRCNEKASDQLSPIAWRRLIR